MPEACVSLWPSDACAWSLADIWRWSDLVQRGIYISLALMFGYTFFVLLRFLRRILLARIEIRDLELDSSSDSRRNAIRLIADLRRGLGTLRAIAYGAPFFGLAGTSYGFLVGFRDVSGSRASALAYVVRVVGSVPVSSVAGIIVAIPAAFSYSLLRTRVETLSGRWFPSRNPNENDLGSVQFAQTLSLRRRFSGLPPFPLLAAPALACAVMAYMAGRLYPIPTGLTVRVLPIVSLDRSSEKPGNLAITLLSRANDSPVVRVNSKEVPWDKLDEVVREKLEGAPEPQAFVEADSEVYWAYVTDVVDTLRHRHCRVILLTTAPARKIK